MNTYPLRQRCVCFFAIITAILGLLSSALASPPVVTTGETIVLPKFVVTAEALQFKGWHKATSPHFVLYSDVPRKEIEAGLRQVEIMLASIAQLAGRPSPRTGAIVMVLPIKDSDWYKVSLNQPFGFTGLSQLMHRPAPNWLQTGIKALVVTSTIKGQIVTISLFLPICFQKQWSSWEKFYSLQPPPVRTPESAAFEEQSSALCYALLASPKALTSTQLVQLVVLLNSGNPLSREDFRTIAGTDLSYFEKQVEALAQVKRRKLLPYTQNIAMPQEIAQCPIVVEQASSKEIRELCILTEIMNKPKDEALPVLEYILHKGLQTKSLQGLLAGICFNKEKKPEALTLLRQTIAAGSKEPDIHAAAARIIFESGVLKINPDSRLTSECASEIQADCRRALELEPNYSAARALLIWSEALGENIGAEEVAAIEALIRQQLPASELDEMHAAWAIACWRTGDIARAKTLCEELIKGKNTRQPMRDLAREQLARLEAGSVVGVN